MWTFPIFDSAELTRWVLYINYYSEVRIRYGIRISLRLKVPDPDRQHCQPTYPAEPSIVTRAAGRFRTDHDLFDPKPDLDHTVAWPPIKIKQKMPLLLCSFPSDIGEKCSNIWKVNWFSEYFITLHIKSWWNPSTQLMSLYQCCGSGMFIPDPNFSIPDPGSRSKRIRTCIKEFKYF